jgi:CheY-like chemotaxis protein
VPKRLLLIDDNVRWTRTISRMVKALGYAATGCNDPMRAVEMFIDLKPDVVLLDMQMPEKDGIEVLDEILLTGIPTKVILTSGYGVTLLQMAGDVAKFHDNPNVVALPKPLRTPELAEALRQLTAEPSAL